MRRSESAAVVEAAAAAEQADRSTTGTVRTRGRHSAATPRWGTPWYVIDMARAALGGWIDLDPMSETAFNETVSAARIFTAKDDGLSQPWVAETLFLNPAGGLVVEAWRKLIAEWHCGNVQRAIWVGFSVEQLALLANEYHHPLDFAWCIPRKRIAFVRHDGFTGSPSHSNYVAGVGVEFELFSTAFGPAGRIGHGQKGWP